MTDDPVLDAVDASMKSPRAAEPARDWTWRSIVDAILAIAMLAFAFIGIVALDDTGTGSQAYWSALALGFGIASLAFEWVHADERFEWGRGTLRIVLHWIGVLIAIQLVYLFIAEGRAAGANIALVNGAVLALGTYLCGVYADWRLIVIGAALALATAAVAIVSRYLWVLLLLAVLALVVTFLIGRWRRRAGRHAEA
ncbi:MAG: hypothetical protein U1E40_08275 [Amaricoccus sp.]